MSCFAFPQPTHTILDFHLMLTHWLTCLQPQRLSTKPSLLPNVWMRWHSQHPWQTRGHPARLNSDLEAFPRLWISDSQQTLYATAAPAFESALRFTYNIQADANLCNCTRVMLSHPRHTHPPPHTTNPSTCSSGLGLVSSSPHPRQEGSTGTAFAGDERVKD